MRNTLLLASVLSLLSAKVVGQSPSIATHLPGSPAAVAQGATGFVRLHVANAAGNLSDEALIVFYSGSPATDGEDVPKYTFSHPTAPRIATTGDGAVLLAINAYGSYTAEIAIPVMLKVATNGPYTLTITGLDGVGLTCLTLEDPVAAITTTLQEGTTYTFDALASAPPEQARFILHGTAPVPLDVQNPTCAGIMDGMATVELLSGPADVVWSSGDTELASASGVFSGPVSSPALGAGSYEVRVEGLTVCGTLRAAIDMVEPDQLVADVNVQDPVCAGEEGNVTVLASGGTAPYAYSWSTGQIGSAEHIPSGAVTIQVSDANGCALPPIPVEVAEGVSPEAVLIVDEPNIAVGAALSLSSGSDPDLAHLWDLGDGTTSTELALEHTYAAPGTYVVSLTVNDGTCSSSTTVTITVGATTGQAEQTTQTTRAWYSNGSILVEHAFNNELPVYVRVLSVTGQVLYDGRYAATPARITVTNEPLTTGVWFVQVANATDLRTFRIPVSR